MNIRRSMTENFNEPCDLIVSQLRAPLNPRIRNRPMLLLGRATQASAVRLWSGANALEELLTWGSKGEMRVWAVNMPKFTVPEHLSSTPTPELFDEVPVSLVEALLTEYPGEKGLVADPCMGSGAVVKAAVNLGLAYTGVESNSESFENAQRRLLAA